MACLYPARYLYINVRPWPRDYKNHVSSVSNPPPVGSKIDRYVLDLGRMSFVSHQMHTQFCLGTIHKPRGQHVIFFTVVTLFIEMLFLA